MSKFYVIPKDTFDGLQLEAGVVLRHFDPLNPAPPADEDIICATTGGINVTCTPEYTDLGEDVDNVPPNMKELKSNPKWTCGMSFTTLSTTPEGIRMALGAADIEAEAGKIVPRKNLAQDDFDDVWWVGDKANGGLVAIRLINALSTAGFSLQTSKDGKGQISVELTGHVSLEDQDTMPMEFYSLDPEDGLTPDITLNKANVTIAAGGTTKLRAKTEPSDAVVTWTSSASAVATVDNGTVTGVAAGNATITATITVDGDDYSDACKVTVTEA